jgi:hypothetical protein
MDQDLTSEVNASSDFDEIDEISSETSLPSLTSHACTFDIQFNTLEYRGQLLQDVQYRPRNKRLLNTKAKISWVYQHGADLQAGRPINKRLDGEASKQLINNQ